MNAALQEDRHLRPADTVLRTVYQGGGAAPARDACAIQAVYPTPCPMVWGHIIERIGNKGQRVKIIYGR